jgi:hypothetical protein
MTTQTQPHTAHSDLQTKIEDCEQRLNELRLAQTVLSAIFRSGNVNIDVKGWSVSISTHRQYSFRDRSFSGPVTIDISYRLEREYDNNGNLVPVKSWRSIAQDIVRIRKLYSIAKLERTVYADTYVENEYSGERQDVLGGHKLALHIHCGDALPSTCELVQDGEEIVPATVRPKYKVVCK